MIVMSDDFERVCEDVIDKRGRFIYFIKNTNLLDTEWCLREIPINAYLKFYEDNDKRIIVIQQGNTYEYYKIYHVLHYHDGLLYLVCEPTTDKEIIKMNQVCRKNDKKANGRNEMSLRFNILLSKFDKIGEVIIVSDIKNKVSGYKSIMNWAMMKKCCNMEFYEDSKRQRYAVKLMNKNNIVLHLGLGYVNNNVYAIAEKKDKRSLRSFRKVEKIIK